MKPGAWLIVAGGWNVQQFKENRRPTQAELVAAAPNNPVYVQLGYGWAMLTPMALKALNITATPTCRRAASSSATRAAADRRHQRRPGRDHRAVRQAAEADVRRAGRGHEEVLPRAESPRASPASSIPAATTCCRTTTRRCSRSGAQREMTVRVAYTLCGQTSGRRVRGAQELGRAAAAGLRRRHAALQRPRRAHHRRDEQQQPADRRGQGAVLRDRASGRRSAACR